MSFFFFFYPRLFSFSTSLNGDAFRSCCCCWNISSSSSSSSSRANEIFFFFLRSSRHVRNLVGVIDFSFHVQDRERDEAQDDSSMDDNTAEKK